MPFSKLATWITKQKYFQDASDSKTGKAPVCPIYSLQQHFLLIGQKKKKKNLFCKTVLPLSELLALKTLH